MSNPTQFSWPLSQPTPQTPSRGPGNGQVPSPPTVDGFTVPNPDMLKRSLAQRLIPVVDRARDLATKIGARPYKVRIVRTRFAGKRRGIGPESVVFTMDVVPTPKVVDMRTLSEMVTPAGVNEQGTIQLQYVSGRYTEEQLMGIGPDGAQVAPNECVYYEVEFFRRDGGPSELRRFQRDGIPYYDATGVQWNVTLVSVLENRARSGQPEG